MLGVFCARFPPREASIFQRYPLNILRYFVVGKILRYKIYSILEFCIWWREKGRFRCFLCFFLSFFSRFYLFIIFNPKWMRLTMMTWPKEATALLLLPDECYPATTYLTTSPSIIAFFKDQRTDIRVFSACCLPIFNPTSRVLDFLGNSHGYFSLDFVHSL
jgi:hypothetical protein